MSSEVIAFCGLAGSGKTSAAKRLIERHGFTRARFADGIKGMCRALGLDEAEIEGDRKEVPCSKLTHAQFGRLFEVIPDAFDAIGVDLFEVGRDVPLPQLNNRPQGFALISLAGVLTQVIASGEPYGGATPRYLMQMIGTEWGRNLIDPDIWVKAWLRKVEAIAGPVVVDDCRFPNEEAAIRSIGGTLVRITRPGQPTIKTSSHESEAHHIACDFEIINDGTLDQLYAALSRWPLVEMKVAA